MKTLITSSGNSKKSRFDLRFGRAAWFCLYDEEDGSVRFLENPFREDQQGAGGKVVEKVMELGVSRVISGDFGPKARDLLDKFRIQMVMLSDEDRDVSSILATLQNQDHART